MASQIQIKRGTGIPGSLNEGELAVDIGAQILYVGNSASGVIELARNTSSGLVLVESGTSNTVTISAAAGTDTYTLTLPSNDGGVSEVLTTDGAGNLTWATPGGGGDVTAQGTPVDNQVGVWTSATGLEGDAALTFDTTTDTLAIGATNDGTLTIGGVTIIDNGGASVVSLQNIDSIDATTEATIEAAIDTLANLTAASSLATVGTITSGTWTASVVGVQYGGTGLATVGTNELLTGNGTGALTSETNLTFDGTTLGVTGDVSITGDLTVAGNTTFTNATTVTIEDSMLSLAANNTATDTVDSGWYSTYNSTGVKYAGIIRDATDGVFKAWAGFTTEPGVTGNFGQGALAQLDAVIDGGSY